MKIIKNIHKTNVIPERMPEGNYLANRIGFWALVKEVDSINNTVTVVSDTGYEWPNIPVKSDEWVTVDKNKDYIPSQRNLPPKNSRVFVLTPTYSITGAFILCSGFSRGDDNIRTLWAKDESELEDKNNCRETKTQGGWDITEEYENGNTKIESEDGNIVFNVNTAANNQKSQNKEVSLVAWDNEITIDEDGITVTDKNNNKFELTSDGITIKDKNNNEFKLDSNGATLTDKNTNKVTLSATGMVIEDKNKNKFTLDSSGVIIEDKNKNKFTLDSSGITVTDLSNNTITMAVTGVTINNHLKVMK